MTNRVSCEPGRTRGHARLLSFLVLVAVSLSSLLAVQGEPSQQRGQQSNGDLGQDFSAGLADGLAALNSYGRGAYTNAKRARKMSAFMPMRGRKDGRDLVGVDSLRGGVLQQQPGPQQRAFQSVMGQQSMRSLNGASDQPPELGQFMRESDPNDDASLLRLISGATGNNNNNYQRHQAPGAAYSSASSSASSGNATPRQFFNQFEFANAQIANDAQHPRVLGGASSPARVGPASLEQVAAEQPGAPMGARPMFALGPNGVDSPGQVMQAKLRRAFHPMRGKKSQSLEQSAELLAGGELVGGEI